MSWLVKIVALVVVWVGISFLLYKVSAASGDVVTTILVIGTFVFPLGIGAS